MTNAACCHFVLAWFAVGVVAAPVARAEVRPLSTDRPDRTESPYTVPARWVQFESDLASWGRIDGEDERVTGTSVCTINAKYGLLDFMDVQFVLLPWVHVEIEHAGFPTETNSGTGQAGLRAKLNLAGNDGNGPGFALLPFAFVPTRGDAVFDAVTWGMVAPFSVALGDHAALSAMAGFTRLDNQETWAIGSITVGSAIAGDFAGFVELFHSSDGFDSKALDDTTFDAGITFAPRPDWQFDVGVYRGVTSNTEDWRVFAGASARFSLSH